MVDCGDVAADWLRSVANIENVRLVRQQSADSLAQSQSRCVGSHQSADDSQPIIEFQSNTNCS